MRLVLGVGNTLLTDDGVGLVVVRALPPLPGVEVRETERGGLDLLELLDGFEEAVLVDALVSSSRAAGEIVEMDLADLPVSQHLNGAHGVDLPTAVATGRALGLDMPTRVHVVAIVVKDPYTLGESLTPEVSAAVPAAVLRVTERLARAPGAS